MKTFVIIFGQLLVEIGLLYSQTSGHTGCEYSFYQKNWSPSVGRSVDCATAAAQSLYANIGF